MLHGAVGMFITVDVLNLHRRSELFKYDCVKWSNLIPSVSLWINVFIILNKSLISPWDLMAKNSSNVVLGPPWIIPKSFWNHLQYKGKQERADSQRQGTRHSPAQPIDGTFQAHDPHCLLKPGLFLCNDTFNDHGHRVDPG